jgi:hypothetical protein
MASEGQNVRFRDCTCPGTPHDGRDGADDGDIVTMRDHLGFAAGAEALRRMGESGGEVKLIAELVGPVYIREGPLSWNVVDEAGPVTLTKALLDALPFHEGYSIAEKGDDLYSVEVISPLVPRMNGHSENGLTARSTRRRTRSSSSRRSPPKPSSPNASATAP